MRAAIEDIIRSGMAEGWTAERITVAVLAAMREPTEAMKEAVRGFGEDDATVWRLMIDAA